MVDEAERSDATPVAQRRAQEDREAARLVTKALAETDLFFTYTHDQGMYIWVLAFDDGTLQVRLTVQHGFLLGAIVVDPVPTEAELGSLLKRMPTVTQVRFMIANVEGGDGEEAALCIAGDLPVIPGTVPGRDRDAPRLSPGDLLRFVGNLIRGVHEYRKLVPKSSDRP